MCSSEPVPAGSVTQQTSRQPEEPTAPWLSRVQGRKRRLLEKGREKQMAAGSKWRPTLWGRGLPHLLHPSPHRGGGRDRVKPAMKMREVGTRKKGGEEFNLGKGKKGYLCNYGLFCGVFLVLFWFFPSVPKSAIGSFMIIGNVKNVRRSKEILLKILWYYFVIIGVPLSGHFFHRKIRNMRGQMTVECSNRCAA